MNEDANSVWLIVRSNDGLCSDEISKRIGVSSNSRVKNHPQGGKTFFLKSEISIKDAMPLADHIDWVVNACSASIIRLREFIKESGNSGELFIYIFTDHDAGYAEIPVERLRFLVDCGLNLSVKIEASRSRNTS